MNQFYFPQQWNWISTYLLEASLSFDITSRNLGLQQQQHRELVSYISTPNPFSNHVPWVHSNDINSGASELLSIHSTHGRPQWACNDWRKMRLYTRIVFPLPPLSTMEHHRMGVEVVIRWQVCCTLPRFAQRRYSCRSCSPCLRYTWRWWRRPQLHKRTTPLFRHVQVKSRLWTGRWIYQLLILQLIDRFISTINHGLFFLHGQQFSRQRTYKQGCCRQKYRASLLSIWLHIPSRPCGKCQGYSVPWSTMLIHWTLSSFI